MPQKQHLVKIKSTESKHVRWTRRNKKSVEHKIELQKYDPTLRKYTLYKETKK